MDFPLAAGLKRQQQLLLVAVGEEPHAVEDDAPE